MDTKLFFADLEPELANTRRLLEAVPEDRLAWRPHEKSMSLGELSEHIAEIVALMTAILRSSEFDLATAPADDDAADSLAAILEEFDEYAPEVTKALAETDDEDFAEEWVLRSGDHVIMQQPRVAALRTLGISHLVHHRGQLGVYLRLLEAPVPGVYGPSADEGTAEA